MYLRVSFLWLISMQLVLIMIKAVETTKVKNSQLRPTEKSSDWGGLTW
ncbi:hypothetical protein N644_3090 [Lactiplantibacillus paraplantarum]|nr:hypothetical protein N644_3090 [Lactiplantibacillus paraplantarum]